MYDRLTLCLPALASDRAKESRSLDLYTALSSTPLELQRDDPVAHHITLPHLRRTHSKFRTAASEDSLQFLAGLLNLARHAPAGLGQRPDCSQSTPQNGLLLDR